jgi:hypothetical protein
MEGEGGGFSSSSRSKENLFLLATGIMKEFL